MFIIVPSIIFITVLHEILEISLELVGGLLDEVLRPRLAADDLLGDLLAAL